MSSHQLDRRQCIDLAAALEDLPETCIARHALISGRGTAYSIGSGATLRAAVIDARVTPGELLAFGPDVDAIRAILRDLRGWKLVEASSPIAVALQQGLSEDLRCPITTSADLYFILTRPLTPIAHPLVRLLKGKADADLYAQGASALGDDAQLSRQSVIEGPVAAAIVEGRVVCAAEANVRTERHANFMAKTLPEFRCRGLSSATAAVAAAAVQSMGLVPLWSCDERNLASRRVAAKVGFTQVSQCMYLIPGK